MCGLAGLWQDMSGSELLARVDRMHAQLSHRGPDDVGSWASADVPFALGHRRLSILDLSKAGAQPMTSTSGQIAIVLNGEIYNHEELRGDLRKGGGAFRGHSDTEVALEAIEHWGMERALARFVGMFALAVWFAGERRLFLIRDRFGVKPLYYKYLPGRKLVFASQLQAFEAIGEAGEIAPESLRAYLKYGYVPGTQSIYRGIERLAPGTYASFRPDADGRPVRETVRRYWQLPDIEESAELRDDPETVRERLEALLEESVRLRLIADVPVGLFLSGGVDSTLVAAMAQKANVRELRTFTIGFSEPGWPDESERATRIAQHLDATHTSWIPSTEDIRDTADSLPGVLDEPFADPSIIPTCLVSKLARRDVTVALSGDGGDEGFLGYGRYAFAPRALQRHRWLKLVGATGLAAPMAGLGAATGAVSRRYGQRIRAAAALAGTNGDVRAFYDWAVGAQNADHLLRPGLQEEEDPAAAMPDKPSLRSLNYHDITQYLPDDILYKVDRASMAVSLEAREPLLDHRLVEYAWRLPASNKMSADGVGKLPLRDLLADRLPQDLVEGPKRGFGAPVGEWMRGPLKSWVARYAECDDPYLDSGQVRKLIAAYANGKEGERAAGQLWRAMLFRAWWAERQAR